MYSNLFHLAEILLHKYKLILNMLLNMPIVPQETSQSQSTCTLKGSLAQAIKSQLERKREQKFSESHGTEKFLT